MHDPVIFCSSACRVFPANPQPNQPMASALICFSGAMSAITNGGFPHKKSQFLSPHFGADINHSTPPLEKI